MSSVRTPNRVRRGETVALRDLGFRALLPLWIAVAYLMVRVVQFYVSNGAFAGDAHAYWLTAHHDHLYTVAPGKKNAFLYSPAFSTIIWPIAVLPWSAFCAIWMVLESLAFAWLLVPLGWRWGVPVLMLCAAEVVLGDIAGFLAVAAVLGMTRAGAWAFPLLTKVTPGLGPVWFAARRQWGSLAAALGVTAAVALVSYALTPDEWSQWVSFLHAHHGGGSLFFPVRAVLAVALTVYAARRNRPELVAVAMLLSAPVVHNAGVPTVLAAIPRLRLMRASR